MHDYSTRELKPRRKKSEGQRKRKAYSAREPSLEIHSNLFQTLQFFKVTQITSIRKQSDCLI